MFVKKINLKIYICLFVCLFLSTNLYSQEYKWIQIGALHGWFAENGSEKEVGAGSSNQQRGLRWPAFYVEQDCQAFKALWIGATNFADINGRTYNAKVVGTGPRLWGITQFHPVQFTMGTKFPAPNVYVDGNPGMYINDYVDDDPDPDLPADRVITNIVNTAIGIKMTRNIYAFSHQLHDNYFIYEYEFTNTGDVNNDGVQDLNNTLEGVYFYFINRYSPGREGCIFSSSLNSSQWGVNTLFESMGDEENSTSPYRAIFGMHGKHSGAISYDNTGGPSNNRSGTAYSTGDGHLAASQYVGWCTIHADRSATDKSDDRSQPRTVSYEDSDHRNMAAVDGDEFNADKMSDRYAWMVAGWKKPRHNELVVPGTNVDAWGSSGGWSVCIGYGPYTIPIGSSIKLVVAEAVAGLSRDECYRIGADWWVTKNCTFPGPPVITNNDEAKNAWVRTGRDSILQTFQRAIDNWNSGLKLPQPPEPPTRFEVNSGGDRISFSWSNSSEGDPTLKSYRLYRSDSAWDSRNYRLVAELPKGTLSYDDMTPIRGYSYYYYLQCVGESGGVELVSNRQHTQTYDPAYLMREAIDDMADMKDIRVVPNPFNVRARDLQYKGERDKIMFLDIPGQCTIRIYTERGDLIKTIEHTNGSGDETWLCTTDYRQVVVSGLYIAHFETPDGRSTFRKFVIIR